MSCASERSGSVDRDGFNHPPGESGECLNMSGKNYHAVGGLEHEFYDFPFIGNVIIPTDFHIFQRD